MPAPSPCGADSQTRRRNEYLFSVLRSRFTTDTRQVLQDSRSNALFHQASVLLTGQDNRAVGIGAASIAVRLDRPTDPRSPRPDSPDSRMMGEHPFPTAPILVAMLHCGMKKIGWSLRYRTLP